MKGKHGTHWGWGRGGGVSHKPKLFHMPAITGHINAIAVFAIRELKVDITITATRCHQPYRASEGISPTQVFPFASK
jgi:hypothetical protein